MLMRKYKLIIKLRRDLRLLAWILLACFQKCHTATKLDKNLVKHLRSRAAGLPPHFTPLFISLPRDCFHVNIKFISIALLLNDFSCLSKISINYQSDVCDHRLPSFPSMQFSLECMLRRDIMTRAEREANDVEFKLNIMLHIAKYLRGVGEMRQRST